MSDLKPVLRKLHKLAWSANLSAEELRNECFDVWNELLNIHHESQPTIAEFFADDEVKKMIEKTKCDVVTIASLKKFGGLDV